MKRIITPLLFICLYLLSISLLGKEKTKVDHTLQNEYVDDALYVKFKQQQVKSSKSESRWVSIKHLFNAKSKLAAFPIKEYAYSISLFDHTPLNNTFRIEFEKVENINDLIKALEEDERIEFVERVPLHRTLAEKQPNDIFHGNIDGVETSWFLDMIGYKEIYGIYEGKPSVKVAIVDNAIWENHEDLSFTYENLYDTYLGINGSSAPPKHASKNDLGWSHGTHCAGLVGATSNNKLGISSLASGITLMGVKASKDVAAEIGRAYNGAIWAADNGAKVISMSLGSNIYSKVEESVITALIEKGVIIIAAAGNNGKNEYFYPSCYKGVIGVASVNSDQQKSSFSNFGTWVDIAAPGGYYISDTGIVPSSMIFSSTYCENQTLKNNVNFKGKFYDGMVGTSMATPLVSSLVGLILSYYPNLNALEMLEILQKGSIKPQNIDLMINPNAGIINAPKTLSLLERAQKKYVNELKALEKNGEIRISWREPGSTNNLIGYAIYANDSLLIDNCKEMNFIVNSASIQTNSFGVKALYQEEDGLTKYVTSTENNETSTKQTNSKALSFFIGDEGQTLEIIGIENAEISIYDVFGKKLVHTHSRDGRVDISTLKTGTYIACVQKENKYENIKFFCTRK